ncbi:MAG: Tfp pilus assembly protein FimT/FimU [Gemmatimonadales bacterium]
MVRLRDGFTLVETMLVVVIIGIITIFALPSLNRGSDSKSVKGGMNSIIAELSVAKTAAITRGRCATVHLNSSGSLWVTTALCGGSPIDTLTTRNLSTAYGVTTTACTGSSCTLGTALDYAFDPRGIPYAGNGATYVITKGAAADTVTVGTFGRFTR